MARLNMLKIIGLVVLLAIALTLPAVLPNDSQSVQKHVGPATANHRANV